MTVYADSRPVTTTDMLAELGIIEPISEAEHVAYLIRIGAYAEAYTLQQVQANEGRTAALDGASFNAAAPVAWQRGYTEALQDAPFAFDAHFLPF
jgi:hypothetical protein